MKNFTLNYWFVLLTLLFAGCADPMPEVEDSVNAKKSDAKKSASNSTFAVAATDYLDYGFYWFSAQNTSAKAYNETTGTVLPVSSAFYNSTKPTVIFFHGWQKGTSVSNYSRNNFSMIDQSTGVSTNTVAKWKADGWNVLIFYWNQFADEDEVKDAEAKIWSATGPRGMRYRLSDGTYRTTKSPSIPVSAIAFNQYRAIFANHSNTNFRFAGHSLGNQLATAVAKRISDAVASGSMTAGRMPERLELLDPFWSQDGKTYLGDSNGDGRADWTGERVRWDISTMKTRNNLAVTWYKSTLILSVGVGDSNDALKGMTAFQSMRFWYLDAWQIADKHSYAWMHYFLSYASAPPAEVTINLLNQRTLTGNVAASASTTTTRIRQMMSSTKQWDQVEGRYTMSASDDQFEVKNR